MLGWWHLGIDGLADNPLAVSLHTAVEDVDAAHKVARNIPAEGTAVEGIAAEDFAAEGMVAEGIAGAVVAVEGIAVEDTAAANTVVGSLQSCTVEQVETAAVAAAIEQQEKP